MTSPEGGLICSQCRWVNVPGVRYCAQCGEPIDPRLIAELHRQYLLLTELDTQIAAGQGAATVQALRDAVRERYLTQRMPQRPVAQPAPARPASAAPSAPAPVTTPFQQPTPAAPAQPHGPVFSWRAFIADQAIAVMAYLGGFLLLIATLTFEVGGWQALPDVAKLGGVLAVYVIFGLLGLTLRRAVSLRTVSRVYLGVFALMTPLAALAVYRFELQARGFPVAGMVCLAGAYAAVVYLALAARTRFVTYAYLGWTALLLAALAIAPWARISQFWDLPITSGLALLLLAPHALRRARGAAGLLASVEPSAMQISAGVSVISTALTFMLTLSDFFGGPADAQQVAAVAAAACVVIPLSAAWSWTARSLTNSADLTDRQTVAALDWLTAASLPLAATAVATWLHASLGAYAYTMAAMALLEGLLAEGWLRQRTPQRAGLRVAVQALAAGLAGVGMVDGLTLWMRYQYTPDSISTITPTVTASAVGLALCLIFALRGSLEAVTPWGLAAGAFLLIGAHATFSLVVPSALLWSRADQLPGALAQWPSLMGLLALALAGLALLLRTAPQASRPRRLRAPVTIAALVCAVFASLWLVSHTRAYSAVLLGAFALAALVVARVERRPVAAGVWAAGFSTAMALVIVTSNLDGATVAVVPVALALLTAALGRLLGRAYGMHVYVATLVATGMAYWQLISDPFETTAHSSLLALGLGGWMALAVALALLADTLLAGAPLWMLAPAAVALLAINDTRSLWTQVALTLALVGVGALLRGLRGALWEIGWHVAALVASMVALTTALQTVPASGAPTAAERTLGVALLFALVAYLIAWQERLPWLTATVAPYALVALLEAGALPITPTRQMLVTLAIALAFTLLGMAARWLLGRPWAPALYAVAAVGAGFAAMRVTPYPERAGLVEAILLGFAALAFFAALLEETPWATLAPATFAAAAALAQPDGRALLPLALVFAAAAFAFSRTRGAAWSLPLYGATMVAAVAATWQGRSQAGAFEVAALVTLAVAAWALAALESRADALLVASAFAALAVSASARAFGWDAWQATLAFAALAWVFELSRLGWSRIPWLRDRGGAWLPALGQTPEAQAAWRDPRRAGQRIARGAATVVAVGVVIGGWLAPESFATQRPQTQALAVALLSLAALLALFGWSGPAMRGWRPALYLAGEALALFVTWELRWLGAQNPQAWIIAPGSAQLIIGALLPADTRIRPPRWVAQAFSVAGALILTLPTLGQSITEPVEWQWRYALLLAVEALALTLLAMGLRNRILALTGSAFVGVAAIRGAIIAVQQNLPVPLVIGVFALALMALATWLSLRARRTPHAPTAR